jgi:parallel beta-helix repeat protein
LKYWLGHGLVVRANFVILWSFLFTIIWFHSAARATDYFVDFASGSDSSDGTSIEHPWQHAPGDPSALGRPLKTVLVGGDVVRFKGGVKYRGSVVAITGGEAGRPIKYLGDDWGPTKAVMVGTEEISLSAHKCTNDPRCFFVDHAEDTYIADLPLQIKPDAEISINDQHMVLSQYPVQPKEILSSPKTDFWPIEARKIVQDSLGWTLLNAGPLPILNNRSIEDMRVVIWGLPNWIHIGDEVNYNKQTGGIHFRSPKFVPFTDRPGFYGLSNHPLFVKSPFSYATISNGRALVFRFPNLQSENLKFEYSVREVGFDIWGRSYLEFKGFDIQGYVGENDPATKGNAFRSQSGTPSDILISSNDISHLKTFGGAIQIIGATNLDIVGNRVSKIKEGNGISFGRASKVNILNNTVDDVALTGIWILNDKDVVVRGNKVTHIKTVHGNGISVYLTNKNIAVENNMITNTSRPITFHGDDSGEPMNLSIVGNLIYAEGEGSVPIASFGKLASDVTIERNILISDTRRGIVINHANQDFHIQQNITGDILPNAKLVKRLIVQNNVLVGNASFGNLQDNNGLQPQLHLRIKAAFDKDDFSDPAICETIGKLIQQAKFAGVGPNYICAK